MHQEIIKFWFNEIDQENWFKQSDEFDDLIKNRYLEIHSKAANCELFQWRKDPHGRLAEIIILDQFSRNMFRGSPKSFKYDNLALALSQEAINTKADEKLSRVERSFLYMPFMHSESLENHEIAVELYEKNKIEVNLKFEIKHKEIIEKFGRYPHRNEILGRKSTEEELEFLKNHSGF